MYVHLYQVTHHQYTLEYLDKTLQPFQILTFLNKDLLVSSSLKLVREIVEQPTNDLHLSKGKMRPRKSPLNKNIQSYENTDTDIEASRRDVEDGSVFLTQERVKQTTDNNNARDILFKADGNQNSGAHSPAEDELGTTQFMRAALLMGKTILVKAILWCTRQCDVVQTFDVSINRSTTGNSVKTGTRQPSGHWGH